MTAGRLYQDFSFFKNTQKLCGIFKYIMVGVIEKL
jgi:hypothetical protein